MTILDALRDPALFGGLKAFRNLTSWRSWLAFLRVLYGLELDATDAALFVRHTGRMTVREGGYPEAVVITGRQSGKSVIAATIGAYEAATSQQAGTYALLLAQDERNARRTLFRYAVEPFQTVTPFAQAVSKATDTTLDLESGVSLAVYPCRPASVRGIRACVAIVDELAFFVTSEGRPMDREMLRAIRPCLATTGGKLLILSSPYGMSGALWDLHRQHYGRDGSPVLVWQATAPEMNPTLSTDYLSRMNDEDPEAYRSEVMGEFRAGLSTLIDPDALEACVVAGRRELPPSSGVRYTAFVDPSGGRSDAFTVAVGHRSSSSTVVDVVRAWGSPFNPASVTAEAAELLKTYRVSSVTGDAYGGSWPAESFRSHGIRYDVSELNKSALYLGLLPVVNSGTVELPDVPELLRELRGLERRRGSSGRDRVDHRPGSHDDQANAVAGIVSLLAGARDPNDIGLTVGNLTGYRDADGVLR